MNSDENQERPLRLTTEQSNMVREAIEAKELGEPNYSAEEILTYARDKVSDIACLAELPRHPLSFRVIQPS